MNEHHTTWWVTKSQCLGKACQQTYNTWAMLTTYHEWCYGSKPQFRISQFSRDCLKVDGISFYVISSIKREGATRENLIHRRMWNGTNNTQLGGLLTKKSSFVLLLKEEYIFKCVGFRLKNSDKIKVCHNLDKSPGIFAVWGKIFPAISFYLHNYSFFWD